MEGHDTNGDPLAELRKRLEDVLLQSFFCQLETSEDVEAVTAQVRGQVHALLRALPPELRLFGAISVSFLGNGGRGVHFQICDNRTEQMFSLDVRVDPRAPRMKMETPSPSLRAEVRQ